MENSNSQINALFHSLSLSSQSLPEFKKLDTYALENNVARYMFPNLRSTSLVEASLPCTEPKYVADFAAKIGKMLPCLTAHDAPKYTCTTVPCRNVVEWKHTIYGKLFKNYAFRVGPVFVNYKGTPFQFIQPKQRPVWCAVYDETPQGVCSRKVIANFSHHENLPSFRHWLRLNWQVQESVNTFISIHKHSESRLKAHARAFKGTPADVKRLEHLIQKVLHRNERPQGLFEVCIPEDTRMLMNTMLARINGSVGLTLNDISKAATATTELCTSMKIPNSIKEKAASCFDSLPQKLDGISKGLQDVGANYTTILMSTLVDVGLIILAYKMMSPDVANKWLCIASICCIGKMISHKFITYIMSALKAMCGKTICSTFNSIMSMFTSEDPELFFDTNEEGPQCADTPQSLSILTDNIITECVKWVATMFGLTTMEKTKLQNLKDNLYIANSLPAFVKNLLSIINSLYLTAANFFLGREDALIGLEPFIKELDVAMLKWRTTDVENHADMSINFRTGQQYIDKLTIDDKRYSILVNKLKDLKKLMIETEKEIAKNPQPKINPITVYISGNPGVGKSHASYTLPQMVYGLLEEDYVKEKNLYSYKANTSGYVDGFKTKEHKVCIIEDLGLTTEPMSLHNSIDFIGRVATDVPYACTMPDLPDKGVAWFMCELLLVTSNRCLSKTAVGSETGLVNAMYSYDALERRFDFNFSMSKTINPRTREESRIYTSLKTELGDTCTLEDLAIDIARELKRRRKAGDTILKSFQKDCDIEALRVRMNSGVSTKKHSLPSETHRLGGEPSGYTRGISTLIAPRRLPKVEDIEPLINISPVPDITISPPEPDEPQMIHYKGRPYEAHVDILDVDRLRAIQTQFDGTRTMLCDPHILHAVEQVTYIERTDDAPMCGHPHDGYYVNSAAGVWDEDSFCRQCFHDRRYNARTICMAVMNQGDTNYDDENWFSLYPQMVAYRNNVTAILGPAGHYVHHYNEPFTVFGNPVSKNSGMMFWMRLFAASFVLGMVGYAFKYICNFFYRMCWKAAETAFQIGYDYLLGILTNNADDISFTKDQDDLTVFPGELVDECKRTKMQHSHLCTCGEYFTHNHGSLLCHKCELSVIEKDCEGGQSVSLDPKFAHIVSKSEMPNSVSTALNRPSGNLKRNALPYHKGEIGHATNVLSDPSKAFFAPYNMDPNVINVARAVMSNQFEFYGDSGQFGKGVCVGGRLCVVVNHTMPIDGGDLHLELKFHRVRNVKFLLKEEDVYRPPDTDLMYFNFPAHFPEFTNIQKHFARKMTTPKDHGFISQVAFSDDNDKPALCVMKNASSIRPEHSMTSYTANSTTVNVANTYTYKSNTVPGDCGSIVFAEDNSTPEKIVGLHISFNNASGRGRCTHILQDDLILAANALKKDKPQGKEAVLATHTPKVAQRVTKGDICNIDDTVVLALGTKTKLNINAKCENEYEITYLNLEVVSEIKTKDYKPNDTVLVKDHIENAIGTIVDFSERYNDNISQALRDEQLYDKSASYILRGKEFLSSDGFKLALRYGKRAAIASLLVAIPAYFYVKNMPKYTRDEALHIRQLYGNVFCNEGPQGVDDDVMDIQMSAPDFLNSGEYQFHQYVGRSLHRISSGGNNSKVLTPIAGQIHPLETAPSVMRPKRIDGELIRPLQQDMRKGDKPEFMHIYGEAIEQAKDLTTAELRRGMVENPELIRDYTPRPLTNLEVTNGVKDANGNTSQWYGKINMKTSPGFPYVSEGMTKEDLCELNDENELVMKPQTEKDFNEADQCLIDGNPITVVFTPSLKDEILPRAKVDIAKTRVFQVSNMIFNLLVRKYCGMMIACIMALHNVFDCSVGLNPFGYDWTELANVLHLGNGTHVTLAGDHSGWDKLVTRQEGGWLIDFCQRFYEPKYHKILELLLEPMFNGYYIIDDEVYILYGGYPSGIAITSVGNSIINSVLLRMIAIIYLGFNTVASLQRERAFALRDYGDDHAICVPLEYRNTFNMHHIQAYLATVGKKYTNPSKAGELSKWMELEDLTYLKRGFVYRDGKWNAPLDLDVIVDILNWKVKTMDNETALLAMYESYAIELSQHPRDVYEKYTALAVNLMAGCQIFQTVEPYNRIRANVGQMAGLLMYTSEFQRARQVVKSAIIANAELVKYINKDDYSDFLWCPTQAKRRDYRCRVCARICIVIHERVCGACAGLHYMTDTMYHDMCGACRP